MLKKYGRSDEDRIIRTSLERRMSSLLSDLERKRKIKAGLSAPKLGPRTKFIHYIYDEKMDLEKAVEKVLLEFPSLERENVLYWYYDEKNKKERGRENGEDEGR